MPITAKHFDDARHEIEQPEANDQTQNAGSILFIQRAADGQYCEGCDQADESNQRAGWIDRKW
ncbi:hypothetical protein [Novosphingobium sp.]|uniref:hypothetical protein n=1 Tax=Novosphingobium sp. TaxID=1874826 RepID=UPI00260F775D|nr:hypothetical protein [Novosphingobium sp.]